MWILWPDTIGNAKLLYVDVHEASVLEPLLQLSPRTGFVTSFLERSIDFIEILLEASAIKASVFRIRVAVPVLEFNPAAGLD